MQEKATLLEQAEKEAKKRAEQLQQANADLARQAAMIRELQAQSKAKKEGHHAGAPPDQASISADTSHRIERSQFSVLSTGPAEKSYRMYTSLFRS